MKKEYRVTLSFLVSGLADREAAHDFGASLADHVLDTFNDNRSIEPLVQLKVVQVKK